jgi:hypothetical protein
VVSFMEADLKRISKRVIDKAKELCTQVNFSQPTHSLSSKLCAGMWALPQVQVSDAVFKVVEGDARNVLCEAVERHHAELLIVGSHGYGAIKRYASLVPCLLPSSPLVCQFQCWFCVMFLCQCLDRKIGKSTLYWIFILYSRRNLVRLVIAKLSVWIRIDW